MNILIVDDDAASRSLFARYLRRDTRENYVLTSLADGCEAIEACRTIDFDCLLIDYQLNDSTGVELVEQLRSTLRRNIAPVVMMSAEGGDKVQQDVARIGASSFLSKRDIDPISLGNVLTAAVRTQTSPEA